MRRRLVGVGRRSPTPMRSHEPRRWCSSTIRGTPFMYYGEEIGMLDVRDPDGRDHRPAGAPRPERPGLPMVEPRSSAGRRCHGRPVPGTGSRPVGRGCGFGDDADQRNVAAQEADQGSVLTTYRRLIALRRGSAALRSGALHLASLGDVRRPRLASRGARRPHVDRRELRRHRARRDASQRRRRGVSPGRWLARRPERAGAARSSSPSGRSRPSCSAPAEAGVHALLG